MNSTATPILIPRILVTAICAALMTGATAETTEPPVLKLMTEPAQDIDLDPQQPISIEPDTGNIVIYPANPAEACQASSGGSCDDVQADVLTFLPNETPTIQRFSTATLNVSWTSRGAWECRGQGGPGLAETGWITTNFNRPPNGSASIELTTVPTGSHDITVQCRNGPATDSISRTLEIVQVASGDCTNRDKPSGLSRETTMLRYPLQNKQTRVWNDVFGNAANPVEFPDGTTITHSLRIDRNKFAQIDFNTINLQVGQSGYFDVNTVVPSSDAIVGSVVASISECAGDFGEALASQCRKVLTPGLPNRISWAEDSAAGPNDCRLDLGKEYFLNLVPSATLPETQDVNWNCNGQNPTACEFGLRLQRN